MVNFQHNRLWIINASRPGSFQIEEMQEKKIPKKKKKKTTTYTADAFFAMTYLVEVVSYLLRS